MAKRTDWLSARRADQLAMARNWVEVLTASASLWGVPAAEVTALTNLVAEAESALHSAESSERTAVITAQCKAAFDALIEKMRFIESLTAARYENSKGHEAGPWGAMIQTIVP